MREDAAEPAAAAQDSAAQDFARALADHGLAGLGASELMRAWDSSPALVAMTLGPDHVLVHQNHAAQVTFGAGPVGHPLRHAFPELTKSDLAPMDLVLTTGEPVEAPDRQVGLRDVTGAPVRLRYVLAPLGPVGEPPRGVLITAIDVTAAAHAEAAVVRADLLTTLSARLTAASDATSGLQSLTDALVPELGDLAAVYVLPDSAERADLAEPLPPQVITVAEALRSLGHPPTPPARTQPSPWEASLLAGEPIVLSVDAESMPVVAPHPASADWLTRAAAHSIAVMPLAVAGRLTGAVLLMAAGDRPAYGREDLPFLSDVAARAGAAIGQLWNQQRVADIALRLQRALLPVAPPMLPGMAIAARYVAGAPGVEVGGDWWDVQDLGQGQVGIGLGDVSGRGISAAAVMGQARAAMRAAGHARLPPAQVLHLLDAQISEVAAHGRPDEQAAPHFATGCYLVVEPAVGRMRVANAGHLPPLIRSADGGVHRVRLPAAAPLGLLVGGFTETSVPLGPGDTMIMFTDGLVEIHDRDLDEGIDLLAAALDRLGAEPSLDVLADRLLDAMSRRPGYGDDDVALVLARLGTDPEHPTRADPPP